MLLPEIADARIAGHYLVRAINRPIVDHENLEVGVVQGEARAQAISQDLRPVERTYHHRDARNTA